MATFLICIQLLIMFFVFHARWHHMSVWLLSTYRCRKIVIMLHFQYFFFVVTDIIVEI